MRLMSGVWAVVTGVSIVAASALCGCGKASDLSTPKGAAKSFAGALERGDADAAKTASTGGDPKLIEAMAHSIGGIKRLHDAAVAKFGDDGKKLGEMKDHGPLALSEIDSAQVKEEGDTATIAAGKGEPMKLKKVSGDWKVDLSNANGGPEAAQGATIMDGIGKAYNEVADEITAGKYKRAADASQALEKKTIASMLSTGGLKLPDGAKLPGAPDGSK